VARGTKLFQAPRSPLIQGRSRAQRPWWQPYSVSVVIGLAWPMIAFLPAELAAGEGTPDIASVLAAVLDAWIGALPILVPSVLAGAAVGLLIAGMWGVRHRWVPGAIAAISGWYLALVLATLIG
jgi:hypothetical protein